MLIHRTKILATVSCGILQERCGKITVSRRKAQEVEAVFRREFFSDEFLRVPCAFLWETVGNHWKKSEKIPAGILLPSSGVFPVRSSEIHRKCAGSRRFLPYIFLLGRQCYISIRKQKIVMNMIY